MRVIANRNITTRNDRFGANLKESAKGRSLDIAVAFFTDYKLIEELINKGTCIRMIVRLNIGTDAYALRKISNLDNISIRYYTSTRFHPKLYIVNHDSAFVGSSNLTNSAQSLNNEINICFDYEEDASAFEELSTIFEEYWNEARVLDSKALKLFEEHSKTFKNSVYIPAIYKELGESAFTNSTTYGKKDKRRDFTETFKRNYQEYIKAFNKLTSFYKKNSFRKWSDIPLRIEIDRFLWWIREYKCPGPNGWRNEIQKDSEIENTVLEYKTEFLNIQSDYLNTIAYNYQKVEQEFSSKETIESMNEDSIFDTLNNVHAFHDLLRFHEGGTEGLKRDFFANNKMDQINIYT